LEKNTYESLPKCWICSSDNLAIGALKAFREKKYRVPEDFSIIGFDNIAVSSFVNPQLTTVDQDQKLLGEKLWEMTEITLSGNIAGNRIIIPQKLVLRESF
jgi:DNA-binding LacI/PurR family transcriptional regulator